MRGTGADGRRKRASRRGRETNVGSRTTAGGDGEPVCRPRWRDRRCFVCRHRGTRISLTQSAGLWCGHWRCRGRGCGPGRGPGPGRGMYLVLVEVLELGQQGGHGSLLPQPQLASMLSWSSQGRGCSRWTSRQGRLFVEDPWQRCWSSRSSSRLKRSDCVAPSPTPINPRPGNSFWQEVSCIRKRVQT